jgi:hypothetical protein
MVEANPFALGQGIAPFADREVFDHAHRFAPGRLGDLVESTFGEPSGGKMGRRHL